MSEDIKKALYNETESMKVGVLKGSFNDIFNPSSSGSKSLSILSKPSKKLIIGKALKDTVFACIDKRANAIASLDFEILRNDRPVKSTNYIYDLFKRPNPLFTWYEFMYLINVYLLSVGEVFIYKLRGKMNIIKELWILPSQNITINYPTDSTNIYKTTYSMEVLDGNKKGILSEETFKYDDIVYIKNPHPKDVYRGTGVLESALLSNDINLNSKSYVRDFFLHGAVPGGYLETDKTLSSPEVTRLKVNWKQQHSIDKNAWEIAVLYGGLKYKDVSVNPASADFIAQSRWSREDIMAMFGVPPVVLGYPTQSGDAKEQHQLFYKLTVHPDTVKITYNINELFFGGVTRFQSYEFKFKNIMPVDESVQVEKARVGATFGAITIDELRSLVGLSPYHDSVVGSQLVMPLNNPPGGGDITNPKSETLDEIISKSVEGVKDAFSK